MKKTKSPRLVVSVTPKILALVNEIAAREQVVNTSEIVRRALITGLRAESRVK